MANVLKTATVADIVTLIKSGHSDRRLSRLSRLRLAAGLARPFMDHDAVWHTYHPTAHVSALLTSVMPSTGRSRADIDGRFIPHGEFGVESASQARRGRRR
jgi:hypothetical protein